MIIQGPYSLAVVRRRGPADRDVPWTVATALERRCHGCTIDCHGECPLPESLEVPVLLRRVCSEHPNLRPPVCIFDEDGCQDPCPYLVVTYYGRDRNLCQFYPSQLVTVPMSLSMWLQLEALAEKEGLSPEKCIAEAVAEKLGLRGSKEVPASTGIREDALTDEEKKGGHHYDDDLP